jgi:hypothetical protein
MALAAQNECLCLPPYPRPHNPNQFLFSHLCTFLLFFFTIAILRASLFNIIGLVRSAPTALQFANAVVDTGVVNKVCSLTCKYLLRIFEKIRNKPNGILWGWRETDLWKNQKQQISWHSPLKCLFWLQISNLKNILFWFEYYCFPLWLFNC